MAQTEFGVKYDGPALKDHTMDVRDLAPSLLALGEMFTVASRILHPDRDPVSLSIKATSGGSFEVVVMLQAGGLWDHVASITNVFNSDVVNSLINLRELLIGGGAVSGGLIWAIKKFFGKRLTKRESVAPGRTRVEWNDGTTAEVSDDLLLLYESFEMRKVTRRFVQPLHRDGIDEIGFVTQEEETVTIRRSDTRAFDVPEPPKVQESRYEVERTLTVVSPVFKDGNKWLLSDGTSHFYAAITDTAFRARVRANVDRFGQGDMLRAKVSTTQTRRGTVLGTEHEIVKVLEHIRAPTQIQLGGEDGGTEAPA